MTRERRRAEVRVLILCGGRGTRALPHTAEVPKPLLPVGDRPLLRHLMDVFAAQGFTSFVLAAGFRAELVSEFARTGDAEWTIDVVDTGLDTGTGARVAACRPLLGPTSIVTYGDGLADIDLAGLLAFHRSHPGSATVTTVPLPSPYGTVDIGDGGRVRSFREKPVLHEHRINGGFLVVDDRAFDHWVGSDLEREVLPQLAANGELFAYEHRGFWKSMDTYKDALELAALCKNGDPPWLAT